MFCFRFIPPILTFTTEGMAVIGVLIGGIYGFIFLDVSLTSLIGVVALGCTGIMNSTGVIAAGFGSDIFVLTLVATFAAAAITQFGLSDVLINALMSIKFAQGRPWGKIFCLLLACFCVSALSISVAA